jgi:hypothetical protein
VETFQGTKHREEKERLQKILSRNSKKSLEQRTLLFLQQGKFLRSKTPLLNSMSMRLQRNFLTLLSIKRKEEEKQRRNKKPRQEGFLARQLMPTKKLFTTSSSTNLATKQTRQEKEQLRRQPQKQEE